MRNPWLDIPLADYEGHMSLPAVGQAQLIADELASLVRAHSPRSVAIVGCAGGNGFDRVGGTGVTRLVGVDINPEFVERARARYEGRISGLELRIADIQTPAKIFDPVDLIYVALVLEYVDLSQALHALRRHCKPDGVVAVLTQLPHAVTAHVTPSRYTSLQSLASTIRLVSHEELQKQARGVGFTPISSRTVLASGGKHFRVDEFARVETNRHE